jgi:nicotinate-nucleotide pyrophosphorylase (carboxylating)
MTPGAHGFPLDDAALAALVRTALNEDAADRDITTIATVRAAERARARLVARQAGVISGVPLALATFRALDAEVSIRVDADDGATLAAGQDVLFISGHARAMLPNARRSTSCSDSLVSHRSRRRTCALSPGPAP